MSPLPVSDPAVFEAQLSEIGLPREIEMRHRIPHFGHVFSGEPGYAAGYYGYQWALSIAQDLFTRFKKEGLLNPKTAADYRAAILSKGGSEDETTMVTKFLGRPPSEAAYKAFLLE